MCCSPLCAILVAVPIQTIYFTTAVAAARGGGPTGDGLPRTSPTPFLTDSQMSGDLHEIERQRQRSNWQYPHQQQRSGQRGLSSVAIQGPIQPTPDPRGAVPDRPVCSSRAWAMIRVRACWMAAVAPKAMRCPASWSRSQARCPTHRATALLRQRQGGRHQPVVARTATGPRLGDGALGWQGHTV